MGNTPLSKEDYAEPCCPLKMETNSDPIPAGRVIEKLDEYLNKNDYAAGERHLSYWLLEARAGNDKRGELTVLNEQIGLYRKEGKKEEGLAAIESALTLMEEMALGETISTGTTLINVATGYKAFGEAKMALPLYERAKVLYEKLLSPEDKRLGGLYNNMALTLMELQKYDEAEALFEKALAIMAKAEHGELEMAITYCNLADLVSEKMGILGTQAPTGETLSQAETQINEYLDKAEELINTKSLPRNGYYAFVCEKCAPTFRYYGRFLTAKALEKQSQEIYQS